MGRRRAQGPRNSAPKTATFPLTAGSDSRLSALGLLEGAVRHRRLLARQWIATAPVLASNGELRQERTGKDAPDLGAGSCW